MALHPLGFTEPTTLYKDTVTGRESNSEVPYILGGIYNHCLYMYILICIWFPGFAFCILLGVGLKNFAFSFVFLFRIVGTRCRLKKNGITNANNEPVDIYIQNNTVLEH